MVAREEGRICCDQLLSVLFQSHVSYNFIFKNNFVCNFLEHHRHNKTNKKSVSPNAAGSKQTPFQKGKDKVEKSNETKNTTTAKPQPSGDKSKSTAKKAVKTTETKKPASTTAASKGISTVDGGQKKNAQPSTE